MAPRTYDMRARATSTAATRERILRATLDLAERLQSVEVSLDQVAREAGTSAQTVLRHFGSRDGLVAAAIEQGTAEVAAERRAPEGDLDTSLRLLVDHYERRGRFVLRLLARDDPESRAVTDPGRALHRDWVEGVFRYLLPVAGSAHDELVDLLVVATDVYTWKLLRLDRGLDRRRTEERIRTLTRLILTHDPEGNP